MPSASVVRAGRLESAIADLQSHHDNAKARLAVCGHHRAFETGVRCAGRIRHGCQRGGDGRVPLGRGPKVGYVCGGDWTFKGTRILVKDVAQGKDWNWIAKEYFDRIGREAIAEAVDLAREALVNPIAKRQRAA